MDPYGIPEAVRLTLVRLTKDALGLPQRGEPRGPDEGQLQQALGEAARLFAFCFLGPDDYEQRNQDAMEQERRLALAEAAPEGREARIVSLALLSNHAHASLAERFETVVESPLARTKI